jgi:hypothetical protein
MNKSVAMIAAALLALGCGLLAGCASGNDAGSAAAGSNGSGVTVFGNIDASVTGIRSQSQSR